MNKYKPRAKSTVAQQRNAFISKAKELEINQIEEGFSDLIVGLAPLKNQVPTVPVKSTLEPLPSEKL